MRSFHRLISSCWVALASHLPPLIPQWIPYKWSAATQLYHNFQFNQGLAFYISLLVFGIWGFFFLSSLGIPPLCVCVCVCVCVCERGRVREEGSLQFHVLHVNPWYCPICYICPFHLSKGWCVACMENKHVFQMCVSNATQWPDPGAYLCACAAACFILNMCDVQLRSRRSADPRLPMQKTNRTDRSADAELEAEQEGSRKKEVTWGEWGREQKECIGQAHRVSTKRCKDLSLLVTALTARRLERNALVIQAPRIGSAPLPLPPCAPPLYRWEHCSGDSFVPLDFWRSPFRTSTGTPCAVRP